MPFSFPPCLVRAARATALAFALPLALQPLSLAAAPALTGQAVNDADLELEPGGGMDRALTAKAQVLLDRAGFSVGVIDGKPGQNTRKAIEALEVRESLIVDGRLDEDVWATLAPEAIEPALIDYKITAEDVAGPFLDGLARDYRELAALERIAFTGPLELLAERFHMDEDLLKELNPGKDFTQPGTVVVVADVGEPVGETSVERIEIDGKAGSLRAYDGAGLLVAFYPATVGSRDTPGPSGNHKVRTVALEPEYTYDPAVNFTRDEIEERLVLPPGPNGPVGSVWIDLTQPTYGIHGTAEPALIDKEWSYGCVRLTNWDAAELAALVREGTAVDFLSSDDPRAGTVRPEELEPSDVEAATSDSGEP